MSEKRSIRIAALTCAITLLIGACASDPIAPRTIGALPRPLSDAERFVGASGNAFTFDLLRQVNVAQRDSNVFLSPLSASMALGLTMNGAAGTTADEMRRTLGFGETSQAAINEGYRGLIGLLRGLDPATELRVANAIFYDRAFPFEPSFLATGKTWFDAEVEDLDFSAPSSVNTINDWVSRATNRRIPTVMDQISPEAVMFVINAVYFKGAWRSRFDPAETADAQFHALAGAEPMKLMHQKEKLRYFEDAEYQAVDLLYGNSAFAMTVVLPRANRDINAMAEGLTVDAWSTLAARFAEREVDLYLPKLRLEYKRKLNDDLKALGMEQAFVEGRADFTGMSPLGRALFISSVEQKTFVDIHEEGTEAAAVTTVTIGVTSMPSVPVMRVDRPFLFAIRERFSGTILFIGKIVRMPVSTG